MENEIIRKISELLGNEAGIETEKVYNYIQEGLKKKEEEKLKTEEKKEKEENKTVKEIVDIMNKAYEKNKNVIEVEDFEKTDEKQQEKKKIHEILKEHNRNYEQTRPEGRLHVVADIKRNRYFLLDEDLNVVTSRVINGIENSMYKSGTSKALIKKRSDELLKEYKYVNKDNVKNVDTITYKLLKDFDDDYSTKYAEKYLKMVTLNPHRRESESDEKYNEKVMNSKKKILKEMNIDFAYNTKGILFLKGAKLKDKIQYMKMVSKQQRIFGAQVNSNFLGLFKNKMLNAGKDADVQTKKRISLSKRKQPKMKFKSFHMPKLNINVDKQKAKKYFGRTVIAGIAGLSLFGTIYKTNSITKVEKENNNAIEHEIKNNKDDNDFKKQFHVNIEQNTVKVEQEDKAEAHIVKNADNIDYTDNIENIEQEDTVITKLNKLINNKWEISSGKYYSSPDGTGNSGKFENHLGAVKVDLLNLLDENGNRICTISPDELNNLSEDILTQVKGFQYHVSNENTVLGWNTDKQLDELNENDSMHNIKEEKDSDMEIGE